MCGIIGYIGEQEADSVLHEGLKKLTYRGYDSWGFGFASESGLGILKDVGDIEKVNDVSFSGSHLAIGHCRWATHGGVTKENAHPHTSCNERIAVVHNGIIENYQELKSELMSKGHEFRSETDTEVISHLIEEFCKQSGFEESVRKASSMLKGSYAFVAMSADFEGLVCVKNGSPLVIGVGDRERFVASDVVAFLSRTNKAIYMEDGDMAVLKNE